MADYYIIEPEVAGGWGNNTEFTRTPGQPVVVHKLHYRFDGWLGDELLESTPCYIATERLAAAITQSRLSGVAFDGVETTRSAQFEDLYPDRTLPKFYWLKVEGVASQDDFGMTQDLQLVVSQYALSVLENFEISHALVKPIKNEEG